MPKAGCRASTASCTPLGDTRPAWKVLRVLGNLLGLPGFDQDSAEEVRAEALGDVGALAARLDNRGAALPASARRRPRRRCERIADVPIYAADAAGAPRRVAAAHRRRARAGGRPAERAVAELGLQPGDTVRVSQGAAALILPRARTPSLAASVVRMPAGHADTATLGAMFGPITRRRA